MRAFATVLALVLISGFAHASKPRQELVRGWYLQSTDTIEQAFQLRLQEFTQIRPMKFLGAAIRGGMHEVTREPLRCVEQYIRQRCGDPYVLNHLSGWRAENTFESHPDRRRQEYSNHIFGLALDIDSKRNPCCGCVKDWAKNPLCFDEGAHPYESGPPMGAYALPDCWIRAFKRYGWHWLGDDPGLRDTMHFEFLAVAGSVTCSGAEATDPTLDAAGLMCRLLEAVPQFHSAVGAMTLPVW